MNYDWRSPGGGLEAAPHRSDRRFHFIVGGILALVFLVFMGVMAWGVLSSKAEHAEFMKGCLQDHKKYECMAMWRAGDKNDYPLILPVPVPVSR